MTFSVRLSHSTKQTALNWFLLVILSFGLQELYKEEVEYWSETWESRKNDLKSEKLAKQYDISELLSTKVKYGKSSKNIVEIRDSKDQSIKNQSPVSESATAKSKIKLTLPTCNSLLSENNILIGRKIPLKIINSNPKWEEVSSKLSQLEIDENGCWSPIDCSSNEKLILIVPYRNREQNLKQFLLHMHEFLQRQRRSYCIKVVEQTSYGVFNRAKLMNVGYDMRDLLKNRLNFIVKIYRNYVTFEST